MDIFYWYEGISVMVVDNIYYNVIILLIGKGIK